MKRAWAHDYVILAQKIRGLEQGLRLPWELLPKSLEEETSDRQCKDARDKLQQTLDGKVNSIKQLLASMQDRVWQRHGGVSPEFGRLWGVPAVAAELLVQCGCSVAGIIGALLCCSCILALLQAEGLDSILGPVGGRFGCDARCCCMYVSASLTLFPFAVILPTRPPVA